MIDLMTTYYYRAMKKLASIGTILLTAHAIQATNRDVFGISNKHRSGWGSRTITTQSSTRRKSALILFPRGGDDDVSVERESSIDTATQDEELSLDDRVHAAMRRLGLGVDIDEEVEEPTSEESAHGVSNTSPPPPPPPPVDDMNCVDGVCTIPEEKETTESVISETAVEEGVVETTAPLTPPTEEEIYSTAEEIATEMSVPKDISLAALYSSFATIDGVPQIDIDGAKSIVQNEIDAISNISEDSEEVKQLVDEGYDTFFVRRSLAFSDMNVDNARAILLADKEDEEMERREMEAAQQQQQQAEAAAKKKEPEMKTVTVDYPTGFDPVAATTQQQPKQEEKRPEGAPKPAKKEDVVFELEEITQLQELVIESPVPVLLDIYADWCGPCKQLTPALENICINAGGMLRLVKVNTDQQRQVSSALEVKSLPTIFGMKDGKILNSFQGLPRDETMIRSFLMGLMVPGQSFNPPVSEEDKAGYEELSNKLIKLAAGASFSFSAREVLQVRVSKLLDELVTSIGGETGMAVADDSARVLRSLMTNVIQNPFEEKFRKIKLDNKVIASKIAQHQPCIAILKSIGFVNEGDTSMVVAKGKRIVNIAPFVEGRNTIDRWIDKNRYQIAAEGRKRKDELNRAKLAAEAEEAARNQVDESEEESEEEEAEESNGCNLKLRLEGKKKIYDIKIEDGTEDTLSSLLEKLPFDVDDGEIVQFTCVAKRLIVKSTDDIQMSKTLAELKLMPSASLVVKIGDGNDTATTKGSLAERAAASKKKTGSHSMHSIGLYAKDDNNKAETFESGGVLYDHVLSDDEDENEEGDVGEDEEDDEEDEVGEESVDSEEDIASEEDDE